MKILFFHRWVGVHNGGTETHIKELADRFQRRGHKVTILTREGDGLINFNPQVRIITIAKNPRESDHSYEDIRVYIHTFFFMLKSFFKLIYLLVKGEYFDVISVHFFTEVLVAKIYTFFRKTPIVFILEGYTPLEAKAAKLANTRISISAFEAKTYRERNSIESIVIPVGVDIARFSVVKEKALPLRDRFVSRDEKLAITVSRLEPRKDLTTLIKAISHARDRLQYIKFLIIGDGISRKKIEEEIIDNRLNNQVFLIGAVNDADLPLYYTCADFFILPTRQEWFGIVFIEAMASGLPTITTNIDACPEVVGNCGLYFNPGDFLSLSKKIIELAGNDKLLQEFSIRAKQRAQNFDWNVLIENYEKQYILTAGKN